jgi:hypothetical protein
MMLYAEDTRTRGEPKASYTQAAVQATCDTGATMSQARGQEQEQEQKGKGQQ